MITLQIRGSAPVGQMSTTGPVIAPAGHCVIQIVGTDRASAAPAPMALKVASGLKAPVSDGRRLRRPVLAAIEAARGFTEGTFFLPGQIVDRTA